jgi:hypothetical protein
MLYGKRFSGDDTWFNGPGHDIATDQLLKIAQINLKSNNGPEP